MRSGLLLAQDVAGASHTVNGHSARGRPSLGLAHSGTQLTVGVSAVALLLWDAASAQVSFLALATLKFPGSQRNKPAVCGPPPPPQGSSCPGGTVGLLAMPALFVATCWPLVGAQIGDSRAWDALLRLVVEGLLPWEVAGWRGSEETGGSIGWGQGRGGAVSSPLAK